VANDNLRAALQRAGLTAGDLAEIVRVDVRTVRRWLSGRTPYPRQRGKVARGLDTTEHDLWREIATAPPPRTPAAQPTDLLAAHPTASDLAAPDWKPLMHDADERIELLGDTLTPILDTPGVPELLATKASHGCYVRILVSDTGSYLAPFVDQTGIEIRVLEAPAHQTIRRFDNQLLLILDLLGQNPEQAPLLHLKRAAPGGLFDRLAEHYNFLWEDAAQPIEPDDLYDDDQDEDDDKDPHSESRPLAAEQSAAGSLEPPAPAPRRWPRRPT
jgi:transcriptional regulator with XRE-family HTH domain